VKNLRSLRNNRSGIIYVWAACFMAIVIYSIYWFVGGYVALTVIDTISAQYNFTGVALQTINLIRNVLYWHPLAFISGLFIWAYSNSRKREPLTYYD